MKLFHSKTLLFAGLVAAGLSRLASAVGTMTPAEANLDEAPLIDIVHRLQDQVNKGELPGAAFQIYRAGNLVYQGAVGYQDRELLRPMEMDTIVRLMSQTKPVVAAGVMLLVEQGKLKLDDPLWKYNNKFRHMMVTTWDGKGGVTPALKDITIKDLLLHTAGFGYSSGFGDATGDAVLNTLRLPFTSLDEFVNDLAEKPLNWQPGQIWKYSWSYDVLGYVIQKITHMSPDDWLRKSIFAPLKMFDTDFYVPMMKLDRFAVAYTLNPIGNRGLIPLLRPRIDPLQAYRPPPFISCGSGLVSTLHDYGRFGLMLLNGGEIDGVRILRSETVDLMWRNQMAPGLLPLDLNGWTSDANTGWGYGGFTISAPSPVKDIDWSTKTGSNRTGSVGWGGGMMTNWIASADNDLLITFATQRLATPIPNIFQEIVVSGAMKSIKGPSPRTLPGPGTQQTEIQYNGPAANGHNGGSGRGGGGHRARGWQDDDDNIVDSFLLPGANANTVQGLLVQGLANQALRMANQQALLEALNRQQTNWDEEQKLAKDQGRRLRAN